MREEFPILSNKGREDIRNKWRNMQKKNFIQNNQKIINEADKVI